MVQQIVVCEHITVYANIQMLSANAVRYLINLKGILFYIMKSTAHKHFAAHMTWND